MAYSETPMKGIVMSTIKKVFTNELGNEIRMVVCQDERGITVEAEGPTSLVEHTWTVMEAQMLRSLLQQVVTSYRTMPSD